MNKGRKRRDAIKHASKKPAQEGRARRSHLLDEPDPVELARFRASLPQHVRAAIESEGKRGQSDGGQLLQRRFVPGSASEPVILRIRMRRGLLDRIKLVVDYDREHLYAGEAWDMSAACREVILAWLERREGEIEVAKTQQFRGDTPVASSGDTRVKRAAN